MTSGIYRPGYFKEGCCIRKSRPAVRGHGILHVCDLADQRVAVAQPATDKVANEPRVGLERRKIRAQHEELTACEKLRGGDAVDADKFQDDAAGVAARRRPAG